MFRIASTPFLFSLPQFSSSSYVLLDLLLSVSSFKPDISVLSEISVWVVLIEGNRLIKFLKYNFVFKTYLGKFLDFLT